MAVLLLGSTGASSSSEGIAATDSLHAVDPDHFVALCGVMIVYVFMQSPFPGPKNAVKVCRECRRLAAPSLRRTA